MDAPVDLRCSCIVDIAGITSEALAAAKPGDALDGPLFGTSGVLWRLRVFLGGNKDTNPGHLSLFLRLQSSTFDTPDIPAKVVVRVLANVPASNKMSTYDHNFTACEMWGWATFLSHGEVLSGFAKGGILTVRVDVTFHLPFESVRVPCHVLRMRSPATTGNLSSQLGGLLESSAGADVMLVCGEQSLKVHSFVLSLRSPVFAALLALPYDGSAISEAPAAAAPTEEAAGGKRKASEPSTRRASSAARRAGADAASEATDAAGAGEGGKGPRAPGTADGGGDTAGTGGEAGGAAPLRPIDVPADISERTLGQVLSYIYTDAVPKLSSAEEARVRLSQSKTHAPSVCAGVMG